MRQTKIIMGMPVTVEIADKNAAVKDLQIIFSYFSKIDKIFSTYKKNSEISRINREEIQESDYSNELREVLAISANTNQQTSGYFNVWNNGFLDPSGMVKGWAIGKASEILRKSGFENFYIDAGGDIQVAGFNSQNEKWRIGIKNPFNEKEIVKVVCFTDCAIATSGTYIRGEHIYNPVSKDRQNEIVSLSIIATDICEADRFATAAFAMGSAGIDFIASKKGLEGYMIDRDGIGTSTAGFEKFVC